jgi:bifunctional isochorismate lyase/aryl carrier protein
VRSTADLIELLANQARPASYAQLQQQLAAAMGLAAEQLTGSEDLFLSGLDSMRLVALLERWQGAGVEVALADLMADPCLNSWWQLLAPGEPLDSARPAQARPAQARPAQQIPEALAL